MEMRPLKVNAVTNQAAVAEMDEVDRSQLAVALDEMEIMSFDSVSNDVSTMQLFSDLVEVDQIDFDVENFVKENEDGDFQPKIPTVDLLEFLPSLQSVLVREQQDFVSVYKLLDEVVDDIGTGMGYPTDDVAEASTILSDVVSQTHSTHTSLMNLASTLNAAVGTKA